MLKYIKKYQHGWGESMDFMTQARLVVKEQAKKKRVTYAQLAKSIEVSVPTIKRWMTKDDFPVGAVDKILGTLEMTWMDLVSLVKDSSVKKSSLTIRQEKFLTDNPKANFIFLLLFSGFSGEQIKNELKISKRYFESICFKLDEFDLITYININQINILVSGPFHLRPENPFSKKYSQKLAQLLAEELIVKRHSQGVFANRPDSKNSLNCFGEFYLSEKSHLQLQLEASKLLDSYREVSRRETMILGIGELQPISFCFSTSHFPVWKEILWEQ